MAICLKPLYIASTVLSTAAFLLFVVAICGVANDEDTLKVIPWGRARFDGFYSGDCWLGLCSFVLEYEGTDQQEDAGKYSDCTQSWCENCEGAGNTAELLIIVAICSALTASFLNVVVVVGCNKMILKISVLFAFTAAVEALVAAAVFQKCFIAFVDDSVDSAGGTSSGVFGVLGWMVLVGFILLSLSVIISCVSFCLTDQKENDTEEATILLDLDTPRTARARSRTSSSSSWMWPDGPTPPGSARKLKCTRKIFVKTYSLQDDGC